MKILRFPPIARPRLRAGLLLAILSLPLATGCGMSTAAEHARSEATTRAARLGHPEIEYRELWSPGAAAALGFLPFGAGGFYVRDRWLALSGFAWPFSMMWVPRMAYNRAIELNDGDFELRMMESLEHRPAPPQEDE